LISLGDSQPAARRFIHIADIFDFQHVDALLTARRREIKNFEALKIALQ